MLVHLRGCAVARVAALVLRRLDVIMSQDRMGRGTGHLSRASLSVLEEGAENRSLPQSFEWGDWPVIHHIGIQGR